MDFSFRLRDALEDGDGFPLHPRRKLAGSDELLDRGKVARVVMTMIIVLVMLMVVNVVVVAVMGVMLVSVTRFMFVTMLVREMHVELHPFDGGLVRARDVEMVAGKLEFAELVFELVRVHAQINQRANEHVAADAAEDVEIKGFHFVPRLIVIFLLILIQAANHPVGRVSGS